MSNYAERTVIMKRVISILLAAAILLSLALTAGAVFTPSEYPDYEFDKDYDDSYYVYKYNGTDSEVVIPDTLYDSVVKRIGSESAEAFRSNGNLVSLIMHDKITKVGKWAVRSCSNLEYVYYSKGLITLEERAFANCAKLSSALLRNTALTDIQLYCFQNDSALKYVSLPDTLTKLGKFAFSGTSVKTVVIPNSVQTIDASCFASNSSLKKVYIPDSVTSIGANLFNKSSNVKVYTTSGSTAAIYCVNNSIPYEIVSKMPSDALGDVNFDGVVDDKDIRAMRSELNGEDVDFNARNCDMNSDCKFDVNDVTMLQTQLNHDYTVVYKYKAYSGMNSYTYSTRTYSVTSYKSDLKEIAKEYCPAIKSPYVTYSVGDVSRSGDTINVTITDSPRYYTVEFNGAEEKYRYKETATLSAQSDSYFITGGRPVAYGSSYSFYVTGDVSFESKSSSSAEKEDIASIDFNSYIITDEKITIELLATADVSSFKRMGVAFAKSGQSREAVAEAVNAVETGTAVHNGIAVHNSGVTKANISGQYQFIYEPYMSLVNAKKISSLCFYTFAKTATGEVVISDVAEVNINSVLA